MPMVPVRAGEDASAALGSSCGARRQESHGHGGAAKVLRVASRIPRTRSGIDISIDLSEETILHGGKSAGPTGLPAGHTKSANSAPSGRPLPKTTALLDEIAIAEQRLATAASMADLENVPGIESAPPPRPHGVCVLCTWPVPPEACVCEAAYTLHLLCTCCPRCRHVLHAPHLGRVEAGA